MSHWKRDNMKDKPPHDTQRVYTCDFLFRPRRFLTSALAPPPQDYYGPNPTKIDSNNLPHRARDRRFLSLETQKDHKINTQTGNGPKKALSHRDCQLRGSKESISHPASPTS